MSGVSDKLRACPLWPGLAPPGRDPSRFALRSVDGGFEDVRDVLSGRCSRSTNSTNSGFVSPSSSSRFMDRMNHNRPALARGWVVTSKLTVTQSTDPNATVGENIDFYGFGHVTGLQYSQFGLWALNSSVLNAASQYIGTYGGALSPTASGSMPTTGTATYNGLAVGSIQNSPGGVASYVAGFSGDVVLNANFSSGAISGSITSINAYILNVLKGSVNDIGISATISGTNISGTTSVTGAAGSGYDITGATGNLVGVFAGPTANEVAGAFNLTGGTNSNSVIGSFGAGSAIAAPTPPTPPTTTLFSEEVTVGGTAPNFTVSNLKTGQFITYTGALPNGISGSPATSTFTITTAGGAVSGTAALGNGPQTRTGLSNITDAQLTVTSSTDLAISGTTGAG